MAKPIMSQKKAHSLSFALFLIGVAILTFVKVWWPGIALVIGLPIALKQYLIGKRLDMSFTLFISLGIFITSQFKIKWDLLLPILFTIAGIYIFFREFFGPKEETEEDKELNKNKEIEEDTKKDA